MKQFNAALVITAVSLLILGAGVTDSQAGMGLGAHYLNTLGDLKDSEEFDSSAFGFLASFSGGASLIRFEADLEWLPDYAFGKDMIQPQAYAFIGNFIYGGVGIGIGHINGGWQDSPFYALRAGVNIAKFDIFTSYRFQSWDAVEDFESDDLNSLTFGALFKF
jgi:hypothetical protein